MRCIRCHDRVRYDRAVVRESDGRVLGGLCAACERDRVGRVLLDGYVDGGPDCLFCDGAGAVALPVHRIEFDERDGPTERRGFPVEPDTPRLCAAHAEDVLGVAVARAAPAGSTAAPTAVADGGRDERRRDGERND
ncbi:hypothetical protein [Halobaculum litoreum]|uniref:hypothetical protein n=1 Tax=Halobaculum litoreum TaxID=3031998 RepID=UPI0024C2C1F3|nr:hypothetical protein [Halobaculum sp. DT92]